MADSSDDESEASNGETDNESVVETKSAHNRRVKQQQQKRRCKEDPGLEEAGKAEKMFARRKCQRMGTKAVRANKTASVEEALARAKADQAAAGE